MIVVFSLCVGNILVMLCSSGGDILRVMIQQGDPAIAPVLPCDTADQDAGKDHNNQTEKNNADDCVGFHINDPPSDPDRQ